MINRDKEILLLNNTVKMVKGYSINFYSYAVTEQGEESTRTEIKVLNPDHSFNYLDQYKQTNGKKTQMDCKAIHQEILNQIAQDLNSGKLQIKGVNA